MTVSTKVKAGLGGNANGLEVRTQVKAGGATFGNANGLKVFGATPASRRRRLSWRPADRPRGRTSRRARSGRRRS